MFLRMLGAEIGDLTKPPEAKQDQAAAQAADDTCDGTDAKRNGHRDQDGAA